jgi:hypothetical protein
MLELYRLYRVEWTQFILSQSCRTLSNCYVVPLLVRWPNLYLEFSCHVRNVFEVDNLRVSVCVARSVWGE